MQIRLHGQIAIVTGASSGIGRATALSLARTGARVAVNYHSDGDAASDLVDQITTEGGQAFVCGADVSDPADVERLFAETVERWGAVDILVANSGLQRDAAAVDLTLDDWRRVIDVNLTGQFLCAQAALRRFRAQGRRDVSRALGKIVCVSSVHDVIPWAGHANYAASKGGVAMLMKTLAQETAGDGVRVNAVSPGAIATPINAEETQGPNADKLLDLIPYGRIGDVEDVANAVTWLVSDLADYMVGATLYVDGGMTLYPGFRNNG